MKVFEAKTKICKFINENKSLELKPEFIRLRESGLH